MTIDRDRDSDPSSLRSSGPDSDPSSLRSSGPDSDPSSLRSSGPDSDPSSLRSSGLPAQANDAFTRAQAEQDAAAHHSTRTFKIWRGEKGQGEFVEYKQDVVE